VSPAGIWWQCLCGAKTHPQALQIWLHIARCAQHTPELREFGREVCWFNWGAPPELERRFHMLLLELAVCEGEHGCWWCGDGLLAKTRHPPTGQYLLPATVLASFQVKTKRAHQAQAALEPTEEEQKGLSAHADPDNAAAR